MISPKQTLNQKGIAHIGLFIALAVIVAGVVGFAAWRVMESRKLEAQASSWPVVHTVTDNGVTYQVRGCLRSQPIKTGFGNFREVTLKVQRLSWGSNPLAVKHMRVYTTLNGRDSATKQTNNIHTRSWSAVTIHAFEAQGAGLRIDVAGKLKTMSIHSIACRY